MFIRRWERYLLWLFVGLYILTFISPAEADTVTLTWTEATQNTDNTPIPAEGDAALAATVINYSVCDSPAGLPASLKAERITLEVPAGTTSYTLDINKPGEYCFALYHRNVAGTWSAMSEMKVATVAPLKVIDTRAYSVAKINDAFFLIVIGEVPLGTPCIETETVNGKYVVPNTAVIFSGTNDAGTVVADCG